jgi:very-short-patch-repair endonuclease
MPKKLTQEEFITKAKLIHGDKYDYSLVEYVNSITKIKIKIHGEFSQLMYNHLDSKGCKKCGHIKTNLNKKITLSSFIERANIKHGNLYYYDKVKFVTPNEKVLITCKIHGEFIQNVYKHLYGSGCQKCGNSIKSNNTEFITKSLYIHGNKYIYDAVDYKSAHIKIIIKCKIHGDFKQTPHSHLSGSGCPLCKKSIGESKIIKYLEDNKIKFEHNFRFNDCRNLYPLPFDFYLNEYNILIEFDGKQHFDENCFFNGKEGLLIIQRNDNIKTSYAQKNKIPILRIPYFEFKNIENLITDFIKNHSISKTCN